MQLDKAAGSAVYNLKTWDSLYSTYQKFGDCGITGGTAEAFSGEVENLFSDDWRDIAKLATLTRQDKKFEGFVLYHINILWTPEADAKLKANVHKHCPSGAAMLCRKIKERLDEVDKEVIEEKTNEQW
jgi:hypothetical protein